MFKRTALFQSILLAMAIPGVAMAVDVSGYLKNETAVFTKDGQVTGEASTMLDDEGHDKWDLLKFENSARFFLNGDIGEESSWHGDLNIIYDSEGVNSDYKGHELYTQNDWLRELYVDTYGFGWDFRLGKQQVVWGTADGIKLLDIINPTDYRELNQNVMEDSRIPIWMINAERNVGDSGNIQLIVSQAEENKIPGLNADGDAGHPFLMKGVDAITGQVNGFLNITPKLASTAQTFTNGAPLLSNVFNNAFPGLGLSGGAGLVPFAGFTVDGFASTPFTIDVGGDGELTATDFFTLSVYDGSPLDPTELLLEGYQLLNFFAQCGFDTSCSGLDPNANVFTTNLMPVTAANPFATAWNPDSDRTSAFEHMPMATFATFNTFSGNVVLADLGFGFEQYAGIPGTSATTSYHRDYPDAEEVNFGTRFKQSLDNGLNYSLNYFYGYDPNPAIDLSWHDRSTGEELQVVRAGTTPTGIDTSVSRTRDQIIQGLAMGSTTSILLRNSDGDYYGAFDPTTGAVNSNSNLVDLRFTESVDRIHNIGASFDYALDTEALGSVVLRGEFLYQKDVKTPVVDNLLLGIGDLSNGLVMEEVDMFKYVLGVDVTVLTNMLVSGQFIQFRNLDYVDESEDCTVTYFANPLDPENTAFQKQYDCSRYTADMPVMNPTNGLYKAEENKEFYSLFFSKPFGDSQEHRWNNITIYEENGGWWNRFDVEYSFTDTVLGSAEWNHYWGDEDTTFGQFEKSSNLQVGLKWIFE